MILNESIFAAAVFAEGELVADSTIRKFRKVRTEGKREELFNSHSGSMVLLAKEHIKHQELAAFPELGMEAV